MGSPRKRNKNLSDVQKCVAATKQQDGFRGDWNKLLDFTTHLFGSVLFAKNGVNRADRTFERSGKLGTSVFLTK